MHVQTAIINYTAFCMKIVLRYFNRYLGIVCANTLVLLNTNSITLLNTHSQATLILVKCIEEENFMVVKALTGWSAKLDAVLAILADVTTMLSLVLLQLMA